MKRSFGLIEKVSRAGNWSHKVDHMKEWYDIQCNVLMKREELRRSERYADLIETHDIKQIIINIMGDFNLVRTEDTNDILKAEKLHHFFALVFSRFINNEEYNRLPAFVNLLLDLNCIYPNMRKEWIENKKDYEYTIDDRALRYKDDDDDEDGEKFKECSRCCCVCANITYIVMAVFVVAISAGTSFYGYYEQEEIMLMAGFCSITPMLGLILGLWCAFSKTQMPPQMVHKKNKKNYFSYGGLKRKMNEFWRMLFRLMMFNLFLVALYGTVMLYTPRIQLIYALEFFRIL